MKQRIEELTRGIGQVGNVDEGRVHVPFFPPSFFLK